MNVGKVRRLRSSIEKSFLDLLSLKYSPPIDSIIPNKNSTVTGISLLKASFSIGVIIILSSPDHFKNT